MWSRFGKSFAQILMALLVVGASVTSGDGHVSGEEWFQVAIAAGSATSVYLVPAVPEWPWMKTVVAAVLAGVTFSGSVALDGLSSNDIINIAIVVFGVALTAWAPADTQLRQSRL